MTSNNNKSFSTFPTETSLTNLYFVFSIPTETHEFALIELARKKKRKKNCNPFKTILFKSAEMNFSLSPV